MPSLPPNPRRPSVGPKLDASPLNAKGLDPPEAMEHLLNPNFPPDS